MSFNFQPHADSSDEEAGGVDLSAWKQGAKKAQASASQAPRQAPAPTAPMIGLDDDSSSDDVLATNVAAFSAGSASKRKRSTPPAARASPPRVSFTSINQPTPRPSTSTPVVEGQSASDITVAVEGADDEEESATRASIPLVPILPRVDLIDEEVVDFTAGDDVVRSVLQELGGDDGLMSYKVEFEDRFVDQVRSERSSGITLLFATLALPTFRWGSG